MSGLFGNLSNASRALAAQSLGLGVTGDNIANINTPGYTRRSLVLAEVPPAGLRQAGRGVEVVEIRAARDAFIESRLRREGQGAAREQAIGTGLSSIEAALGVAGGSLDARLTGLFNAFSGLANDVTSAAARDHVVRQATELSQSFHDLAASFEAGRRDADGRIRASVDEINEIARRVATLNAGIAAASPQAETLRDQRDVALARLAALADTTVVHRADGAVDVTLSSGRAIVVGAETVDLVAVDTPGGYASLRLADATVTAEITGGTLGGLLGVRDQTVPGYAAALDQLAYDVATAVNGVHTSGFDANGAAGGAFFTPLGAPAGAASAIGVSAAVVADSRLVAGSATGAPGDNGTARALAGLAGQRIAQGGTATPGEAWGQVVYRVGSDIASARANAAGRQDVILQLGRLRDQTSRVSLDEEAANLMKYQRAYEANARYFTTIADTLDILMRMVR